MWQTKPERKQKEETKQSRWGFRGKTVWDWLDLLLVPLVVGVAAAGLTAWFNAQQDMRQAKIDLHQTKIENKRAETERQLAEERAQDEALQAYLDQMTQLILERNLMEAEVDDPVYTLAQARTSTIITRLDAEHNQSVTRFLSDSRLTGAYESSSAVSVLKGIDLDDADLSDTVLVRADLREASLKNTDLSEAGLLDADLSDAVLNDADLGDAYLAIADLSDANLNDANLSDADLNYANLSDAFVLGADLRGASLDKANLRGVVGITEDELAQEAESLEGATMPNGQKYEDWLKSKGREEE